MMKTINHLLMHYSAIEKGNPRTYKATKKANATFFKKEFHPIYLEQISFVIKRAGWRVTKIYSHFTFEQEHFKKDFILMNQKSRQNTENSIEKDFYKVMNNSNCGYDCRNNLDNCQFVPVFDELKEITYLKRYYKGFKSCIKRID